MEVSSSCTFKKVLEAAVLTMCYRRPPHGILIIITSLLADIIDIFGTRSRDLATLHMVQTVTGHDKH